MLHAVVSRSYPYGYGSPSSPSQASVHSLSVQSRLPSREQYFSPSEKVTTTTGKAPYSFGYS